MTEALAGWGFPTLEQAQIPAYSESRFRNMHVVTSCRQAGESARAKNSPADDGIYRASWGRGTYIGLISICGARSRCIPSMLQQQVRDLRKFFFDVSFRNSDSGVT